MKFHCKLTLIFLNHLPRFQKDTLIKLKEHPSMDGYPICELTTPAS